MVQVSVCKVRSIPTQYRPMTLLTSESSIYRINNDNNKKWMDESGFWKFKLVLEALKLLKELLPRGRYVKYAQNVMSIRGISALFFLFLKALNTSNFLIKKK
ncbi:hypothetical protein IscW_ISCW010475 [Ixodes scapularis]|uniref:Uncharacterized protein n=1 Tax=Ixodes scapularis TaxID=6945 RepID=B7Q9D7_IXOSC|nr:hypothetical protein IscW_ISCW010475 [Ixodes scapularis]|eukprot:XP_002405785.1 hypothetical protein IscW_ISCW010475 [Ixodes scapularis]